MNPKQQLLVNFSLNFSSPLLVSVHSLDIYLKESYAMVQIPTNYVFNKINFISDEDGDVESYYFCDIFSRINASDKGEAYHYQELIQTDPADTSSLFSSTLRQILNADHFDMTPPKMDS